LSSAVFNNSKFVEVVLAMDAARLATTQEVANLVGINHDLAGKVLRRLADAGLVKAHPRTGGSRGPMPYEVQENTQWRALVTLAMALRAP
jgi:ribosomal protein S25